jgi:hypothetical protein
LAALIANPFYVGQDVNLDLGAILFPLGQGQVLSVSGLPPGLRLVNGIITGTITGENSDVAALITVKQGKTTVASFPFNLNVQPFQLTGSYEMLLETAAAVPVGKAKLTITGPKAYTATLELQGQRVRSVRASLPANLVTPLTVTFPALGTISNSKDKTPEIFRVVREEEERLGRPRNRENGSIRSELGADFKVRSKSRDRIQRNGYLRLASSEAEIAALVEHEAIKAISRLHR